MIRSITQEEGSITVFHIKQDLQARHIKAFAIKLQELIDSGRHNLVIELSAVHEICLMGLVTISSFYNKCRQNGGSLKVACLNEEVRESFHDTNLINTIEVFSSVLEAIKSFQSTNLLRNRRYTGSFFLEDDQSFVAWDRLPVRSYFH